jgi:hypothetical protein
MDSEIENCREDAESRLERESWCNGRCDTHRCTFEVVCSC